MDGFSTRFHKLLLDRYPEWRDYCEVKPDVPGSGEEISYVHLYTPEPDDLYIYTTKYTEVIVSYGGDHEHFAVEMTTDEYNILTNEQKEQLNDKIIYEALERIEQIINNSTSAP